MSFQALINRRNYLAIFAVILIIAFHAFLRLNTRHLFTFDYDQAMIMEKVLSVQQGKMTLIGTRIGEFSFFLGPAYIYLTALLSLPWHGSPFFMFYYAYFWSLLGMLALVYWTRRLYSTHVALFLGAVYAISPFIIYVDRISWNPNPLPFITFMVVGFTLDWINHAHAPSLGNLIGIGLLLGFGINCHFSMMLLWLWFFGIMLIKRQFKYGLIVFCIAFSFVIPVLLFDLRHQFLNVRGLFALANSSHDKHLSLKLSYPSVVKLRMVGELVVRTFGMYVERFTFIHMKVGWIVILIGLLCMGWPIGAYLLGLVGIGMLFFGYYSGAVPEYYYLYLLPAIFWAPSKLLFSLPKRIAYILALGIIINLLRLSIPVLFQSASQSLECKYKTLTYVKQHAQNQPVFISYEMKPGWNFGYPYIASYLGLTVSEKASHVFTLTYPVSKILPSDNRTFEKRYCDIGINQDWK